MLSEDNETNILIIFLFYHEHVKKMSIRKNTPKTDLYCL